MHNSKPLVIVLSRNYSTGLGVIRSLGVAGYTVDLIASTKKKGSSVIPASSKYVRKSTEVLSKQIQGDDGSGIITEILKYKGAYEQKPVLFPADDFTASIIATNQDLLKDDFYMPSVLGDNPKSLVQAMDKSFQLQAARGAGLNVPRQWSIDLENKIEIPTDIEYPCFVKPLQSVSGMKSEMAAVNSPVELKAHLEKMKSFYSHRAVAVQEYLHIAKEYDISGLCLDQKVIMPALIEKTRISKNEPGVTMSGRVVPIDTLGELKEKITSLLKSLRYVGMFDIELTLCDNKIYFNEINLRSGGPNYAYMLCGVNLPDIFVKEVTGIGHNACEESIKTTGKTFVYEKVAWEDYIHSHISKSQLKDCINKSDLTLLADKNDPQPGKIFLKRIKLSLIKHKLLTVLGKEKLPENKKPLSKGSAVVTGRNYCNILTTARALGKAGYNIQVLRVFKGKPSHLKPLRSMTPEAKSTYVTDYRRCILGNSKQLLIDNLLKMASREKKLLIPTDDYVCWIVDNNIERLKEHFYIPSVNGYEGGIVRLMDKSLQKELAAKQGLPVLQSVLIKSVNGEFEIPKSIKYPCFIKPNVSMKSNKGNMKMCDSLNELTAALNGYAKSGDFEILVEEYAVIKNEYSLLGVCANGKITTPGIIKVVEGGHRQRRGVALKGELIAFPKFDDIKKQCEQFVLSLGYTGMYDIDLIETAEGRLYFIELNFRAGASTHALTVNGVNLPAMLADSMLFGKEIESCCPIMGSTGFVSEKILIEEYARGDISAKKAKEYYNGAQIRFIDDYEDTAPYKCFKKNYPAAFFMRLIYRLIDSIK